MSNSVCVVTVTYGDRWIFLSQVLKALLQMKGDFSLSIVVVDNTLAQNITDLVRPMAMKIYVVPMGGNTGSAKGFGAGIQYANKNLTCDFMWLLDDDNLPNMDALSQLLCEYKKLGGNTRNTLQSMRDDRPYLSDAILRRIPIRLTPNSFLGFDIRKKFNSLFSSSNKSQTARDINLKSLPCIEVDYSTYGGFFFHSSLIKLIGLPRQEYYIYVDDNEYTNRVVDLGGKIYLTPRSIINDLECSERYTSTSKNVYVDFSYADFKVFHEIRNKIHFERSKRTSYSLFYLNSFIYTIYLLLLVFIKNDTFKKKKSRAVLIIRSIFCGLKL